MFLYKLTLAEKYKNPAVWNEDTEKVILDHFNWMQELGNKGILIFAGRTLLEPADKNLFGIALINAETPEQAHEIMKHDPGVVYGVQKAEIFPFRVAIDYFQNYIRTG